MRILLATNELAGVTPYTGGIGTLYADFATGLAARGHRVTVLIIGQSPSGGLDGVELLEARTHHQQVSALVAAMDMWRLKPDVVIAPEWGATAVAYARLPRRSRLITHSNQSLTQRVAEDPMRAHRSLKRRLRHAQQTRAERVQALHSDLLVACSRAQLAAMESYWDLGGLKRAVIPNAIHASPLCEIAAGSEGPREPLEILYFGRLEAPKGVFDLASAMLRVWQTYPDTRLTFIGHSTRSQGIDAADELRRLTVDHAHRVEIRPAMDRLELLPRVARAAVVALPSWWEAFGLTALEAMGLGRTVVATSGGGFEDFIVDGENGVLVPPGDEIALADGICRVIRSPDTRRRLAGAAAATAKQFDWERTLDRWETVLVD